MFVRTSLAARLFRLAASSSLNSVSKSGLAVGALQRNVLHPSNTSIALFSTSNNTNDTVANIVEIDDSVFTSSATRDVSFSTKKHVRASPRKMGELCRMIRGLSVEEAKIQLGLSGKRNAKYLSSCIHNAAMSGVNNFFMDKTRLIITTATATKGVYLKKIRYHGKGCRGIQREYHCHLRVGVSEQPYEESEVRIGRKGRKISNIETTLKRMKDLKAAQAEILLRQQEAL